MQVFLDLEIKRQIERYIAHETSLAELKRWLAPVTMEVEQSGSPLALDLAYEVQLRLAEFSDGYWTEDELRDLLRPLASTIDVVSPGLSRVWGGSRSRAQQLEPEEVRL